MSKRALWVMCLANMVVTLVTVMAMLSPGCGRQQQTLAIPAELRAEIGSKPKQVETKSPGAIKKDATPPLQATRPQAAVPSAEKKAVVNPIAQPNSQPTLQPGELAEKTSEQKLVKPYAETAASMRRVARAILLPLAWAAGVSFVLGGIASIFVPVVPRKAVAAAGGGLLGALLMLYTIDRYGPLFAEFAIWATVIVGVLILQPWISAWIKHSRVKAREKEALLLITRGHSDAGVAMLAAEMPVINSQRKGLLATIEAVKTSWQATTPPLPDVAKQAMLAAVVTEAKRSETALRQPTPMPTSVESDMD